MGYDLYFESASRLSEKGTSVNMRTLVRKYSEN